MSIDLKLTIALAAGELIVLVLMLYRQIWRTLPLFSIYMLWSVATDAAGIAFTLHGTTRHFYFNFYMTQTIIDAVLLFAVLVELAWSVLRPVRNSLPRGALWVLIVLVGVATLIAWPLAGGALPPDLTPQAIVFEHVDQTFIIVRIIFFLIMAGFSQLLSITWRDRELQIVTGFGVYSIVSLLVAIIDHHQTDRHALQKYHLAVSISYLCSLAYWVLSFSAKEYQRKEFSPQMQQFLVYMGGTAKAGSLALSKIPPDQSRKRDR